MNYTEHLSTILRENRDTELSSQTLGDILNIIYLEGAISSLEKVKSKDIGMNSKYKYDVWIKGYKKKLDRLTGNLSPQKLFSLLATA